MDRNIFLLINILFISARLWAAPKCETEIRVNDSRAVIEIDGFPVATGHYTLPCKPIPQHVTVKAADKMRFVRMMPAASDFDIKDSFWNVRLSPNNPAFTEAIRTQNGQPGELLEMLEEKSQTLVDKSASLSAGSSNRAPSSVLDGLIGVGTATAAATAATSLPTREFSSFEPVEEFYPVEETRPARLPAAVSANDLFEDENRKLKGIYVQVRALPGIKKDKVIAAENVQHMADKLTGTELTMCPAYVPETNKTWTKILVGPVSDAKEAGKIAKNYGYGAFVIRDPPCPVTKNDSFRM